MMYTQDFVSYFALRDLRQRYTDFRRISLVLDWGWGRSKKEIGRAIREMIQFFKER